VAALFLFLFNTMTVHRLLVLDAQATDKIDSRQSRQVENLTVTSKVTDCNDGHRSDIDPKQNSISEKSSTNSTTKNLVAFTALGTPEAVNTVVHNAEKHFADDSWECIVFVYANETVLSDLALHRITSQKAPYCSITRLPGTKWSQFLLSLSPAVTSGFDHIAVVLDDVLAPASGKNAIHVPRLLDSMQRFNFSTISPSVHFNNWQAMSYLERECITEVNIVETFFQIFTNEMWRCFWNLLRHDNPHGYCLDLVLQQACGSLGMFGVDESMAAYHLGTRADVLDHIPDEIVKEANLSQIVTRPVPDYKKDTRLCAKYKAERRQSKRSWRSAVWCPPNGTLIPCPRGWSCQDEHLRETTTTTAVP